MAALFDRDSASSLGAQPVQLNALLEHLRTMDVSMRISSSRLQVRSYHSPVLQLQTGSNPGLGPTGLTTEMSVASTEFDYFSFVPPDGGDDVDDGSGRSLEVELVFGLREIKALITFCQLADAANLSLHFIDNGLPLQATVAPEGSAFSAELFLSTMQTDMNAPEREAMRAQRQSAKQRGGGGGRGRDDTQRTTQVTSLPDNHTGQSYPQGYRDEEQQSGGRYADYYEGGADDFEGGGGYSGGDRRPSQSRAEEYDRDSSQLQRPFDDEPGFSGTQGRPERHDGQGHDACAEDRDMKRGALGDAGQGGENGPDEFAMDPFSSGGGHQDAEDGCFAENPLAERARHQASSPSSASPSSSAAAFAPSTARRYDPSESFAGEDDEEESPELLAGPSPHQESAGRGPGADLSPSQSQPVAFGMASGPRRRGRDFAHQPLLHESEDVNAPGDSLFLDSVHDDRWGHPRLSATSDGRSSAVAETPQKPWPEASPSDHGRFSGGGSPSMRSLPITTPASAAAASRHGDDRRRGDRSLDTTTPASESASSRSDRPKRAQSPPLDSSPLHDRSPPRTSARVAKRR